MNRKKTNLCTHRLCDTVSLQTVMDNIYGRIVLMWLAADQCLLLVKLPWVREATSWVLFTSGNVLVIFFDASPLRSNCPLLLCQMDCILMLHPIWAHTDSISKSDLIIHKQLVSNKTFYNLLNLTFLSLICNNISHTLLKRSLEWGCSLLR